MSYLDKEEQRADAQGGVVNGQAYRYVKRKATPRRRTKAIYMTEDYMKKTDRLVLAIRQAEDCSAPEAFERIIDLAMVRFGVK